MAFQSIKCNVTLNNINVKVTLNNKYRVKLSLKTLRRGRTQLDKHNHYAFSAHSCRGEL